MRVLIAEDDIVSRCVLEGLLQKWDYQVVSVTNGRAAWDLLQRPDPPGLIILDWMMPGMSGEEICRKLRQKESGFHPYIIMLTGKGQKEDFVRGFDAGVDDYLTKPFDQEELRVRIHAGERIVRLQIESAVAVKSLRKQATHDDLTGILNRAAVFGELQKELGRISRTSESVAVVMSDLDHFKPINDTYGHHVGDHVLVEVAKAMVTVTRSYESVGRYGGDEFLLVLTDCELETAVHVADRCRREIASREIIFAGSTIPVTASFGVACSRQLEQPSEEQLIRTADAALYQAKNKGRDFVVAAKNLCMDPAEHRPR